MKKLNNQLNKWMDELIHHSPRMMGSTGANDTVDYLINEIKKLNLEPELQGFDYEGWELVSFSELQIESPSSRKVESYPALGSAGGTVSQGRIVEIGETIIWDMYNWPRFGVFSNDDKILAYITARKDGSALSQTIKMKGNNKPHLFVGKETYDWWKEQLKLQNEIVVSFDLQVLQAGESEGNNIIVRFPGDLASKNKIPFKLIIGAHYDTMYNTKGAYDNATGVIVLLSLIMWLKEVELPIQVECVFFGAEEFELAGSNAYVEKLTKQEIESIDLMLNLDGFGRGDELELWVGSERLEQLVLQQHKLNKHFSKLIIKSPPPPGSDHTPFFNQKVPVGMFTVNDQEIIHSNKDVPHENMTKNMKKIIAFMQTIIREWVINCKN
ncbi:hypothetical protein BTR22_07200 [Alkalihalophilus pseudofirmus]|uniref:M28 family metallopeptidase n=1 Tax=Alkalihalophilus pseudofirmus TaxID=79885 RepID=UPI000950BEFE|nr:hypothetical protein BTR22_07200 [Alkalihalophilus pseudofirmus]